jgi:predicted TPR repeat methyltransferase
MHLVVSADHLHRVLPLDAMLAEVARVLSPGGVFVFTVPFDVSQEVTRSEVAQGIANGPTLTAQAVHAFGWDVMDRVRRAGFADCCAHCYWSEELGYLGTFNFVFEAFR